MDTKSPNLEHLSERIDSVEFGKTDFSKLVSQPVYLLAIVVTPIDHAHYNAQYDLVFAHAHNRTHKGRQ